MDTYRLIGRLAVPCRDMLEWARWMQTADRKVALTEIGPLHVSTVFLGLDHRHGGAGDPLLFETMIFGADEGSDWLESHQERCSTWGEAEEMHARGVAIAQAAVEKAAQSIA